MNYIVLCLWNVLCLFFCVFVLVKVIFFKLKIGVGGDGVLLLFLVVS